MNTHGEIIEFGKHKDELFTRVPVSYLTWMVNQETRQHELARAELERRHHKLPEVELSAHAIDNASLRCRNIWHETSKKDEGLYTWLERMTLEALANGQDAVDEAYMHNGMKLVIVQGAEFPALKTIMAKKTRA